MSQMSGSETFIADKHSSLFEQFYLFINGT